MAKIEKTEKPVPEEKAPPVVTHAPAVVKRDPAKTIGLESGVAGEYLYFAAPADWDKDRTITAGGRRAEHTCDDADGCWIYRHM